MTVQSLFYQEFDKTIILLAFEKMQLNDVNVYTNNAGLILAPIGYQLKIKQLINLPVTTIRIYEDIWHNKRSIVLSRINSLLGKNRKVHGRLCMVQKISQPQAEAFLQQHHIMGSTKSGYKYGLFYQKQLLAVMTFTKARTLTLNNKTFKSYELIRFATFSGITITGGFNKLLQKFVEDKQPDHLMTYADNDWGIAHAYPKLGFAIDGITQPIDFWVNPITHERSYQKVKTNNSWIHFQTLGNTKWIKFCK